MTPPSQPSAQTEAAITRKAADFDLPALLAILHACFPARALRFEGRASRTLEPALVHAVRFDVDSVLITLNLGLLSSTSPLPAYFDSIREHPRAGPALDGLLHTINEGLLAARAFAMSPLTGGGSYGANAVRASALNLSRRGSPVGLTWIFERVFPELTVSVRRVRALRPFRSPLAVLSLATLGEAAIGGDAEIASPAIEVQLETCESTTWNGVPWGHEVRRRLSEHVLPSLRGAGVGIRVVLIDRDGQARLVLQRQGDLGFAPLERGDAAVRSNLFEGMLG